MARRYRAAIAFVSACVLVVAAGAVWAQANAGACGQGCRQSGLAIFDPMARPDGPGFALMRTADGQFVRYDPCTPIHYVVNARNAPPSWRSDLDDAITMISDATGLTFLDDGATTERPRRLRPLEQPRRYGARWAPVLIAWTQPGETDLVPYGAVGNGGSAWVRDGQHRPALVTGEVVLDAEVASRLAPGITERFAHGRFLAHELAHLVGLAHSGDPSALLSPDVGWSPDVLTLADRSGLARVGRTGGCLAVPSPAPDGV